MPELPEVEVTCRGLRPHILDRKILAIDASGKDLRTAIPLTSMRDHLIGTHFLHVNRRAKYLLLGTAKDDLLIIHLGMTGKLGIFSAKTQRAKHDHLSISFDNDTELRLNDTRRFGSVHFIKEYLQEDLEKSIFLTSGPEPFSDVFSAPYLKKRAKGRSQAVKTFIMNSTIVVGVGNIYANESLFAAGIHPQTAAGNLSMAKWKKLIHSIQAILHWAIECGGSTISDFRSASGESGYFQVNFKVYGRDGKPCVNCGSVVKKVTVGNRATFFCPNCQRKGR